MTLAIDVVEADFSYSDHPAPIGRDVLAYCLFTYDGRAARYRLEF